MTAAVHAVRALTPFAIRRIAETSSDHPLATYFGDDLWSAPLVGASARVVAVGMRPAAPAKCSAKKPAGKLTRKPAKKAAKEARPEAAGPEPGCISIPTHLATGIAVERKPRDS